MDNNTISLVKKLLSVAERSTFPEESAVAFAKAQALITKHKIDKAILDNFKEEEALIKDILNKEDYGKSKRTTWKGSLAGVLSKYNGCYVVWMGPALSIFGKEDDVRTVQYLYEYCSKEIDRLTKLNCSGYGRTYCNNFRFGCITAIGDAIKAERDKIMAEYADNVRALVVVDQDASNAKRFALTKLGGGVRKLKANMRGDNEARLMGMLAGSNIYKGKGSKSLAAGQLKLSEK